MNPEKIDEFLKVYKENKELRTSLPTKSDILLEFIKVYYDSTTKRDKKRAAKLILKSKDKLIEFGYWDFINEKELIDL